MLLNPDTSSVRVVPWRLLLLAIAGGIGASFLLMPTEEELRDRMQRDRAGSGVTGLLQTHWNDEQQSLSQALTKVSNDRLAEIMRLCRLTPRERLHSVMSPRHIGHYDAFSHALVRSAIEYVDVIPPEEAYAFILPKLEALSSWRQMDLLSLLATNALAVEKPSLAADMMVSATALPGAGWPQMKLLMESCQWSDRAEEAVKRATAWLDTHRDQMKPEELKEARARIGDLCVASNRPGDALELYLKELKTLPQDRPLPEPLLERAYNAASFAGHTEMMQPWIKRYLEGFREQSQPWQSLLQVQRPLNGSAARYARWLTRAAQVADWNTKADEAYAFHLRLLALGKTDSLDRFLSLSSYLGEGEETEAVLKALGPIPGHEDAFIYLARLIAANGDPHSARGMFERWISTHPDDRDARYELANLIRSADSTEAAIAAFESFLKAFPEDVAAVKRLADLLLRVDQGSRALDLLDGLAEVDLDPITLENYITLAEAEERDESLLRGLKLALRDPKADKASLYVRMFELVRSSGDFEAAEQLIHEGIAELPERPMLRVLLAGALIEEERWADALDEALHPSLREREDAVTLALSATTQLPERAADTIEKLGMGVERRMNLTLGARLDLAVVYHQAGRLDRSNAIFAMIAETDETLAPLAEARLLLGQYDEARRLAELNIQRHPAPATSDWLLLGDARVKMGLTTEAREAYDKALGDVRHMIRRAAPPKVSQASPAAGVPVNAPDVFKP